MNKNIILPVIFTMLSGIFTYTQAAPTVYIPLGAGNQVIAVDAATDKIKASYSGVEDAHGLVATPDGEYLIAGSLKETPLKKGQPKDTPNSKLFFIHPVHGHVMSTIPVSGWTHHQAITGDGRYVISTHGLKGSVSVVDLESNKVIKIIPTGPVPNFTLITKDNKYAFVSNSGNNSISVIDLKTWKVIRKLDSGPAPEHMVFSADESRIFATNPRAGKVSVVDVKTGKVIKEYKIGKASHGLDMGNDGKTIFVSSKKANLLVAIDTKTGVKRELELSPSPYHLNTIPGTNKVYVSSSKKPLIWVVDQKTMKLTGIIKLPAGEAHQMAIVE
ncbi:MAG: PQQ-binding-like beta-propeller repeat protein [Gammaproteobacteria bacterium]|nr:PQQ-binding-like beta-propeller repeat protein [Gammaproteobacteria bacterium]